MLTPAGHLKSEQGAVAVITAIFLFILVGVAAFVLEIGYLYATKNRYQYAVEAAAMAGAADLCGSDPIATAREIAIANGCPDTEDLQVYFGFYDELGLYEDFSVYQDFEADPDPGTPYINEGVAKISDGDPHYNNAVMVVVDESSASMTGLLTDDDVRRYVASVAYLKRYDVFAGKDGLSIHPVSSFAAGYPEHKDTIIHSNGDISFNGTESFSGDVNVTAYGSVSSCTTAYTSGVPEIELKSLDTVMEDLYDQADSEGTLIDTSGWIPNNQWDGGDTPPPFGHYRRISQTTAYIAFKKGDHNGAVYYLSTEGGVTDIRLHPGPDYDNDDWEAWNFTMASDANMRIMTPTGLPKPIVLGGDGERTVYFYVNGDISRFQPSNDDDLSFDILCQGVFFRCRKFTHRLHHNTEDAAQKMRISADKIIYRGMSASIPANPLFDSLFGPPCPPCIVRLGLLQPVE